MILEQPPTIAAFVKLPNQNIKKLPIGQLDLSKNEIS